MKQRSVEIWVGMLMVLAALALAFLALKVSGLGVSDGVFGGKVYKITAEFGDIGNLKIRAPVKIAGVEIGAVSAISLDRQNYQAKVTMNIQASLNNLSVDSSARITSSGLLGDNYVSLIPGYETEDLKDGSKIITTYSATNLQTLISTFMSGGKNGGKSKDL